jgi:hypothetical protein
MPILCKIKNTIIRSAIIRIFSTCLENEFFIIIFIFPNQFVIIIYEIPNLIILELFVYHLYHSENIG